MLLIAACLGVSCHGGPSELAELRQSKAVIVSSYSDVFDFAGAETDADELHLSERQINTIVDFIEASAILPDDAYDRAQYERFYHISAFTFDGRPLIAGTYYLASSDAVRDLEKVQIVGHSGAFWAERDVSTKVTDGGCSVLRVFFDIERGELIRFRNLYSDAGGIVNAICNGVA